MHLGKKVAKARDIIGIKQDEMARYFKISQQAYSKWEQGEDLDESTLNKIALKLGVTVDFIKSLNEESGVQNLNSHCTNVVNYQFNPIEKIVELYERLLKMQAETLESKEKNSSKHI
nr:helix-turn-helix transcriptional regulator [Chitinophagaceae bacterium]